jgi:hypothetical protein
LHFAKKLTPAQRAEMPIHYAIVVAAGDQQAALVLPRLAEQIPQLPQMLLLFERLAEHAELPGSGFGLHSRRHQ